MLTLISSCQPLGENFFSSLLFFFCTSFTKYMLFNPVYTGWVSYVGSLKISYIYFLLAVFFTFILKVNYSASLWFTLLNRFYSVGFFKFFQFFLPQPRGLSVKSGVLL